MARILHLCRSDTEACLGAVSAAKPGFVVSIGESDGLLKVRAATSTIFGPVNRCHHAPERDLLFSLVVDTLRAGEHDVWLVSIDERLADELVEAAERDGHTVLRQTGKLPAPIADPFALFAVRRLRAEASQHADGTASVLSFCKVDPQATGPVGVGDVLTMHAEATEDGAACDVYYANATGLRVGEHGRMPCPLDEDALALLAAVRARITYVSWGREWRAGRLKAHQIAMFEIPAEVDALLADARLPRAADGEGVHA